MMPSMRARNIPRATVENERRIGFLKNEHLARTQDRVERTRGSRLTSSKTGRARRAAETARALQVGSTAGIESRISVDRGRRATVENAGGDASGGSSRATLAAVAPGAAVVGIHSAAAAVRNAAATIAPCTTIAGLARASGHAAR